MSITFTQFSAALKKWLGQIKYQAKTLFDLSCNCLDLTDYDAGFKVRMKIDQADFTDWLSSYHLTSWGKSALIQKTLTQ